MKGIELKSRRLVRGLYANRHRTADHGASTEFVEHREYRRGDELRNIDWRVFGRTSRLFVKVHEHESHMRANLVLDTSDSMRVPPPAGLPSKLELGSVIAGAIGMLVATQQDAVGLLCLGDTVEEHIPARQGMTHLTQLYQHLAHPRGEGGGRFGRLVHECGERLGTRAMTFLITDGLDNPEHMLDAMKNLRARQQDVTLIQILDRNELEFPFDRMTEFRHPETGGRIVGDPATLRSNYLERLNAHLEKVADYAQKAHAEYLRLSTADDLLSLLSLHFVARQMRRGG